MSLQGNWVDLIILAVLVFFVFEAFRVGLWIILADFLSFLLSMVFALRGYQFAANLLKSNFALSHPVANALGFLLTAIIAEAVLGFLFAKLLTKIPKKLWHSKWSKWVGIFPAIGEGLVIVAFISTLVMGFPVAPSVKEDISNSQIGGRLIIQTSGVEAKLNEVFGGVIQDSLTYLTVKPQSDESVALTIETFELSVDASSETELFNLVNEKEVSRDHAEDMWKRKYFAHVSPDGEDVGDRLDKQKINYGLAGENLALAPTVQTAHTGLMNSEGHRRNILEPEFKKIGIGVIDNEYYGKMFVQVFSN